MNRAFREKRVGKTGPHCLWHPPEDASNRTILMHLPELLESICFSPNKSIAAGFAPDLELHQEPFKWCGHGLQFPVFMWSSKSLQELIFVFRC